MPVKILEVRSPVAVHRSIIQCFWWVFDDRLKILIEGSVIIVSFQFLKDVRKSHRLFERIISFVSATSKSSVSLIRLLISKA